jgi:Holliday junction resolvasome RuvABC endonuclease subunit
MARTKSRGDVTHSLLVLDVAFAKLGWSIFADGAPIDCGVITTEKSKEKIGAADDRVRRCQIQAEALKTICEKYNVKGVLAELPGGAQDANAAIAFGLALGTLGAFLQFMALPIESATPHAVKKALAGKGNASKAEMMEAACEKFGGSWVEVPHGKKTRLEYTFCGMTFGVGAFEHIADSCGVYEALRRGNLVKLFG